MVHSAIKRKRSSEELSDGISREQSVTPSHSSPPAPNPGSAHPVESFGIFMPLPWGPADPRLTVLALLNFLSDVELFNLITTRISQAAPWDPPLFLSPFCIAGLHDFFIPLRPAVATLPTSSSSPFSQIPTLFEEKRRIRGKIYNAANKARATALLVSLATLFHFLTPSELRFIIHARISASQVPHRGVGWFLEFMQSGGDGVPRGKKELETRKAKQQEKNEKKREEAKRLKAEKRRTQEQTESQDIDMEEGELNVGPPPMPSAAGRVSEPAATAASPKAPQPPPERKKKRSKGRRNRNSDILEMPYGDTIGQSPAIAIESSTPTPIPSNPPFPGMGTPFLVEPFQPPIYHPVTASSQTCFQV